MSKPKLITFYFPQFHSIPENSTWWGEGFTDWELVKKAAPLYTEHYQPRVPLNKEYYNPVEKETLKKQIDLAKKYGIGGFSFYHYWFDGKLYLEKPLETFLAHKDLNIPFCLTWANESWTRSWVGKPEIILQKQTHLSDKNIWKKHIEYLLPFFLDERAIRIDNKPVFLIYQPFLINETKEMFDFWNETVKRNGLDGIYYIAVKNHQFFSEDFLNNYNGLLKFQPREAYLHRDFKDNLANDRFTLLRKLPEKTKGYLTKIYKKIRGYKIYDANKVWKVILDNAYINEYPDKDLKIFEGSFIEWDNTARYKNKANIFTGLDETRIEENFNQLITKAIKNQSPYIFFTAWNEWSESSYLEPDEKNGYKYLEIMKRLFE